MWTSPVDEEALISGILKHGPDILENCIVAADVYQQYVNKITAEHLHYPAPKLSISPTSWLIPDEFQTFDIEKYLVEQCPEQNLNRLHEELALFTTLKMIPVLRLMKYIVDTLRKNNIVWGVGRGSSVASYTLFLIGVHKIDSVKYQLPIDEFLRS